jgi:hypothetical protein
VCGIKYFLAQFLIVFSLTTLANVIFGEINFAVFLRVVVSPSGLPSYIFFTYFLLVGGRGLDLGVGSSFDRFCLLVL